MLSNTKPIYQYQASRLLQIALWHFMTQRKEPLTMLQLSLAEDEDATSFIRLSDKGLTATELRCQISSTGVTGLISFSSSSSSPALVLHVLRHQYK
jgi:hypothetical protein